MSERRPPPTGVDQRRLRALRSYRLDGCSPEAEFGNIVRLAMDVFDVPIAYVSLVEEEHQFLKASVGLPACSMPSEASMCAHTLRGGDVLVVTDARADVRFASNPMVEGQPFVRFYAGAPIVSP